MEHTSRKRAIIELSLDALHDILHLPADTKLLRVRQEWHHESAGVFQLLVESPDLPEVFEGNVHPIVPVQIRGHECSTCHAAHVCSAVIDQGRETHTYDPDCFCQKCFRELRNRLAVLEAKRTLCPGATS